MAEIYLAGGCFWGVEAYFKEIEGTPVSRTTYEQMLRSYDAGVAEFLDLSSVKPNTLGNTRMLAHIKPQGVDKE